MSTDALYHPPLMPHLLIEGSIATTTSPACSWATRSPATARCARAPARWCRRCSPKGLGRGSRIAVISANRPEVLSNIAAMQMAGCIGTPLHPLGSLDDHAYVLEAAEIDTLVYDASVFDAHAAAAAAEGTRAEKPAGLRAHRGW